MVRPSITVLGVWEKDWMDTERTERRVWKQTIQAFGVDRWAMCGVHGGPFTSPQQHDDLESMLASYPGKKTFLVPPGRKTWGSQQLSDYSHPDKAIYVFGNSYQDLVKHIQPKDDVVSIHTPMPATMFGHVVLAAVLYDRMVKL